MRGIGLWQATALNMIDMIGVGPFVTIPLIVSTMHGPQAMLGWIFGALLCVCDGLVWAELGAAMPQAGGPVRYLRAMYGPKAGGWLAFLFVFQLTFSAPLSMASGAIGFAQYTEYLWPALHTTIAARRFGVPVPLVGSTFVDVTITNGTFLAMATVGTAVFLLYRRIGAIGRLGAFLWVGVILTTLSVIATGVTHFSAARAFTFPPGALTLTHGFLTGLGGALLIAVYDYWGYYNVCYLGGEIRDPGRVIPRAILLSIAGVAALYLTMNIAILGAMPWQEVEKSRFIASDFMARFWGPRVGAVVTVMMLWTAFASVFSLLLGYSRVPYAAALEGDYFKVFAKVHPTHHFPHVSLLWLGGTAAVFCLFKLADVVTALVVIRISVQFLAQTIGILVLRRRRPDMPRPFRMWLYPVPAVLAFVGFVYVIIMRPKSLESIRLAVLVVVVGTLLFFVRRKWGHSTDR
ncbi:MAG: basic amino acid/polyamine antiporter, family [Acidobacteriota bacterium]